MNSIDRREDIVRRLAESAEPISASAFAASYGVSRQIIVGDIALLRASGEKISSTPRGYILSDGGRSVYTLACVHNVEDTEKELNIMVDNGCKVLTVAVEHPVYGLLTGELQLASRYDVHKFVEKLQSGEVRPLSELTDGVHLHTLDCPDGECFERTRRQLAQEGLLYT